MFDGSGDEAALGRMIEASSRLASRVREVIKDIGSMELRPKQMNNLIDASSEKLNRPMSKDRLVLQIINTL